MIANTTEVGQQVKGEYIDTRGQMAIFYGTTSGTSAKLAFEFAQDAQKIGFFVRVINLSDFDPAQLSVYSLAVFITSTYGRGGPTGDARQFFDWIMSEQRSNDELKGLKYALFGLGNMNHAAFCGMGVKTDERLSQLGAERIYKLGKGNAQNGTTLKDFEEWKTPGLLDLLQSQFPFQKQDAEDLKKNQQQLVLENVTNTKPILLEGIKNMECYQFHCQQYLNAYVLQVKQITELKKDASFGNSAIFIDLDATPMVEKNIKYKTAGNIQVYPENDEQSILDICNHFKWDPSILFEIKSNPQLKHQFKLPFPTPLSVYDYLAKFCDLHGNVNKKQLYELSKFVQNKEHSLRLQFLASFEGKEEYKQKITNEGHSLYTVLKEYKIRGMSLLQLIEIANPIRPRFYTIASSSAKYPTNIHIVCSALKLKNPVQDRLGVSSQYLKNQLGASKTKTIFLRVALQESLFKFPTDPQCPVILVGPGAGVAPMRALIQEKDVYIQKGQLDQSPLKGPMTLYFGCRTKDEFIFENELKQYEGNGTLESLKLAFSREQNKVYVTNLLGKDLRALASFFDKKGTLYICGSMSMGRDILTIIENMFIQVKNIEPTLAKKQVVELEKEGLIIKEIWG